MSYISAFKKKCTTLCIRKNDKKINLMAEVLKAADASPWCLKVPQKCPLNPDRLEPPESLFFLFL